MILFPNAKINIGLRVLRKRPDGYHDIESIMIPVGWCDILELVPASTDTGSFTLTGSDLGGCPPEKSLVIKALTALENYIGHKLPPLEIHLHKQIPDGAGLGGGSADASFALIGANQLFQLGLSDEELASVAAKVGADCPFFIYNRPMLAEGIGEKLSPVDFSSLRGMGIAIVKPEAEAVSTKDAYAGICAAELPQGISLIEFAMHDISLWSSEGIVCNDFEQSIFPLRPIVADTLAALKAKGALYAAMSGSGAALFGIFPNVKMAEEAVADFVGCRTFAGALLPE